MPSPTWAYPTLQSPLQMFLLNNRLFEAERTPDQDVHQRLASSQLLKNAKVGWLVGWLVSLTAILCLHPPGWPANNNAGAGCCSRFVSANTLLAPFAAPLQGSHLLLCGSGGVQQPSGAVRMPLSGPAVSLPELRVDGSSEGLLGSKLWGYRWGRSEAWLVGGEIRGCKLRDGGGTARTAAQLAKHAQREGRGPLHSAMHKKDCLFLACRLAVRVLDGSGAPLRSIAPALSDQAKRKGAQQSPTA